MEHLPLRAGSQLHRADFQQKRVARFEVTNHAIGEEENEHGYRGKRHEPDIDAAMQALARVAKLTLRQVRLIVAAHFRSETRDVVAPSGKDFADDAISTLCHQSRRTLRAPQRARRAETTVGPQAAVHAVRSEE